MLEKLGRKTEESKKRKVSAGSTFDLEKELLSEGYDFVIGIDEAGRGPLAGPVVAAATTVWNFQFPISNFQTNSNNQISNDKNWGLIRDSKTLSHKQRESVFDFIHQNFHVGVGICDHQTIDRINILEATYLAAKKAIASLMREISNSEFLIFPPQRDPAKAVTNQNPNYKLQIPNKLPNTKYQIQNTKYIILFDGNKIIPNLSMEQKAVVNGDKIVKSISAASIVAKVTRDRIMLEMHAKYPEYGFDKHKGYGTKVHMEALQQHGSCPIHRRSFAPVRKVL